MSNDNLYYLQDSRSFCGNDVLWWSLNRAGYTTDLTRAHVFTKDEAIRQHQSRETDIPWPKEYIDNKIRSVVDMQYIDIKAALGGTGITLLKPQKAKRDQYRCNGCFVFMSEVNYYSAPCKRCGTENRP